MICFAIWNRVINKTESVTLKYAADGETYALSEGIMYKNIIKPIIDRVLALIFVLLFWWLYIILAILVRIKLGSPVLFTQERPGKIDSKTGKERIFKLYKYRTMTSEKDASGQLLPDEIRLTKFGQFLRSTSLDELPEILFNILLGKPEEAMSWVGPRPLLVEYLPRYNKEQRRRHEAAPGLTGYAQVSGRNSISWGEKFEDDIYYVDHISFLFDIKIILKTIGVVLKRTGISSDTSATMEVFTGSNEGTE